MTSTGSVQGLRNGDTTTVTLTSPGAPATVGILTVNRADLVIIPFDVIKARDLEYTFDGTEFSADGLKNGETIGSVTLTSPGANAAAAPGVYPIHASDPVGGTFDISNYNLSFVDGALTVSDVSPFFLNAQETNDGFDQPWKYAHSIQYLVIATGTGEIILIAPTNNTEDTDDDETNVEKGTIPFDLRFNR